jgi:putative two-component system response regulator
MTSLKDAQILIVDDQESNVLLIEKLLRKDGYTQVTSTTNSADVAGLFANGAPDLLLLDLQMPEPDGFAVMKLVEHWTTGDTYVPVLVLTADANRDTRRRALAAGARDFLTKPFDADEVYLRIRNLLRTRQLQLELQSHNEDLEDQVQCRTRELERARMEAYDALALAAEYRDDDTRQHTRRVGGLASALAGALGFDTATLAAIAQTAALHDLGKIGIPDAILLKPGKLTEQESTVMKEHARIGSEILSASSSPLFSLAAEIALTHHERWDGAGYPQGLAGAAIPLPGRIVALADAFDAMTHDRPYKAAMPLHEALAEVDRCAGTHFDRGVVEAFRQLDPQAIRQPARVPAAAPVTRAAGASSRLAQIGRTTTESVVERRPSTGPPPTRIRTLS